jgi:regulator of replication initiation timing
MSLSTITYILFGIVVLLIILIAYFTFHFLVKKKNTTETIKEINQKLGNFENSLQDNKKNQKNSKNPVKSPEDPNAKAGSTLLTFDRITDDMIIRNDGTLCSAIIQCKGINVNLMSEDEKKEVQQNFVSFLNSITNRLQLHVQTRILDLSSNVSAYIAKKAELEAQLKNLIDEFNKLKLDQNADRNLISKIARDILKKQKLYEYAKDLIEKSARMCQYSMILQSNYYIIVSCSASELGITIDSKHPLDLNIVSAELSTRCNNISTALYKCGIETTKLNSAQLAELLFSCFPHEEDGLLKLREYIESGLLKLYSLQK